MVVFQFYDQPPYHPTPHTGVAGFVVNDKNEVLLQITWVDCEDDADKSCLNP